MKNKGKKIMWAAAKGARQKRAAKGETKGQNNKARHSQKRQEKAKNNVGRLT